MPTGSSIGQAPVAGQPSHHLLAFARGASDRGGAGIARAGLRIPIAGRVIADLANHPGAEDLWVEPEKARDTLMEKCSTSGTPPHQSSASSATSRGTI